MLWGGLCLVEQGLVFISVCGFLIAVASLVAVSVGSVIVAGGL